jgi:hypothetical protein
LWRVFTRALAEVMAALRANARARLPEEAGSAQPRKARCHWCLERPSDGSCSRSVRASGQAALLLPPPGALSVLPLDLDSSDEAFSPIVQPKGSMSMAAPAPKLVTPGPR